MFSIILFCAAGLVGSYLTVKTVNAVSPNSAFGRMAGSVLDNLNWFSHSTKAKAIKRARRLLDEEKAKLPEHIERMSKFMAQVKRMERLHDSSVAEANALENRVTNLINQGFEAEAQKMFPRLKAAKAAALRNGSDLKMFQQQLAQAKEGLGLAKGRIKEAEDEIRSLGERLELTEFRADMAKSMSAIDPNSIGAGLADLPSITEDLQREIDEAEANVELHTTFSDEPDEDLAMAADTDFASFAARVRGQKALPAPTLVSIDLPQARTPVMVKG